MLFEKLQLYLETIYEVKTEHRVDDFIIRDPQLASLLDRGVDARDIPEKLLIHQHGEDMDVALYLDSELIDRLELDDPTCVLHDENLCDFWTALEGISHFLYLVWNATYARKVSMLELELQAEVDKYIVAAFLIRRQYNGVIPRELHYHLFANARFDDRLTPTELERYRDANYFAGKFCSHLQERFFRENRVLKELINELRRFYRLPQRNKIAAIQCL